MTEDKKATGEIVDYNVNSGRGQVRAEGRLISFGSGSFDSGWPVRPPQVGDHVEVRLTETQHLMYVRLRKEQG